MNKMWLVLGALMVWATPVAAQNDIKVLATNRTSTLQKEMNEAADAGYRFAAVMGGDTSFGGSEAVVIMTRTSDSRPAFAYKVLATSKTGTMQKELQDAGNAGFEYKGQTSYKTAFGGKEVVVLLERDISVENPLVTGDSRPLFTAADVEAELVVRIYDREGRVQWPIPLSIRHRSIVSTP